MNLDRLLTPFLLLLGLVTSFRLNDAFHKWERAAELVFTLHREARTVIHRMCAFLPAEDPVVWEQIYEVRRLLLLGCVLPADAGDSLSGNDPSYSVRVEVSNNGQESDASSDGATLLVSSPPSVFTISPHRATELGGTQLALRGHGFANRRALGCSDSRADRPPHRRAHARPYSSTNAHACTSKCGRTCAGPPSSKSPPWSSS